MLKGHRRLAAVIAGLCCASILSLAGPSPASAAAASLSPAYQSRSHGQTANWSGSWGHNAPYNVSFTYGDGGSWGTSGTNATSRSFSRTWWPCTGRTYNQQLIAIDSGGGSASAYASTYVSGGSPC